ncbi:hypothetical protein [Algoriphagus hitonicola]|uniref:hypothetical protein n=1 Tax=Algoriphagus hitonicola TaxID=435880 RepID=UPI0011612ED6|nr:hypothetical protein [Algoriphagus hitonicola]
MALFYYWVFPTHSSRFIRFQLIALGLYHVGFSFFYHQYLTSQGGDAIRYWEVSADLSQYAQSWMGYFGFSTFFIQWLNYIPYKVLDLSFLSGNLGYGFLSFIGLIFGALLTERLFERVKNKSLIRYLPFLIWWFPGIHFWTAGVSKEALLFLGLMGLFYFSFSQDKSVYLTLIFWLLVFLVKPLIGLLFVFWLLILFWKKSGSQKRVGIGLVFGLLPVLYLGARWLWAYSHLEAISFSEFMRLSQEQMEFLSAYQAHTELPMLGYSWIFRLISVFFRPFIWEIWDIYSLIFALENLLMLGLFFAAILLGFRKLKRLPLALSYFLLLTLLMFFLYSMTLNNYGLFYRMKSVWLPFLYISFLWLIWPFIIRKSQ